MSKSRDLEYYRRLCENEAIKDYLKAKRDEITSEEKGKKVSKLGILIRRLGRSKRLRFQKDFQWPNPNHFYVKFIEKHFVALYESDCQCFASDRAWIMEVKKYEISQLGHINEEKVADMILKHLNKMKEISKHPMNLTLAEFVTHYMTTYYNPKNNPNSAKILLENAKPAVFEFVQNLIFVLFGKYWDFGDVISEIGERLVYEYVTDNLFTMGIYKSLLKLYRCIPEHHEKDELMEKKFISLSHLHPSHLDVSPHFKCLKESKPYPKTIKHFQLFHQEPSIETKLKIFTESLDFLQVEAESYSKRFNEFQDCTFKACADDLVSLVAYCLIQSKISNVFSMFQLIDDFIRPEAINGIQGYLLATLQTSANYLLQCKASEFTPLQPLTPRQQPTLSSPIPNIPAVCDNLHEFFDEIDEDFLSVL